jgi:hypothetical protein
MHPPAGVAADAAAAAPAISTCCGSAIDFTIPWNTQPGLDWPGFFLMGRKMAAVKNPVQPMGEEIFFALPVFY